MLEASKQELRITYQHQRIPLLKAITLITLLTIILILSSRLVCFPATVLAVLPSQVKVNRVARCDYSRFVNWFKKKIFYHCSVYRCVLLCIPDNHFVIIISTKN